MGGGAGWGMAQANVQLQGNAKVMGADWGAEWGKVQALALWMRTVMESVIGSRLRSLNPSSFG